MVFVLIGISAHPVWLGLIFSYVFGYKLGWTPIAGYCDFINPPLGASCGGPVQWAYHMILPWCTFAILFAALYVRMIRANVLETMNEDYVRTARAKGAPENSVMRSHILRNAMLPVVTMLGMDIALALGGAVFTESIYGLPGLGNTLIHSLDNFDFPTTMGIMVFATTAIIIINLFVDLLYAVHRSEDQARPRWRFSRSRTSGRTSRPTTASSRLSTASASPSRRGRRSASSASRVAARASRA